MLDLIANFNLIITYPQHLFKTC